ncbi:DEKNAAC103627 [Brettanomyces naardenensis]|uniref:DEKNAAC103627 n=1 Tax=Brettanomyces naardenensis TaxID=13370 RepID=A0A448YP02_BRENA|nr:DEKNAAC103627 [Brettanomyces naardenensis]
MTNFNVNDSINPVAHLSLPQTRRRRHSSVGKFDLGDTSVRALHSIPSRKVKDAQAEDLNRIISKEATDEDVLRKLWVSLKILGSRHTWVPPLLLLAFLRLVYWLSNNYTASNPLHAFFDLSYEVPGSNPPMYGKGLKDLVFVFHMMIFFTFFREFVMQVVLKPLSGWVGLTKRGKKQRFMEQSYSIVYYGITSPLGLYIMYHTPMWFFKTAEFYKEYPHLSHQYLFKLYYLGQAGFWAQQSAVLMLQLEKPRKDYKELVYHHIVTMLLIGLSYRFHFTWIGLAVYITMDVSDFFLASSKTLNYLDSAFTTPFFITFIVVWFYARHYLNIKILISVLTEFRTVGPFELNWEKQYYKCSISEPIVFTLIFLLQLVNIYWSVLVIRIGYRYILLDIRRDERSDDESTEEEEDKEDEKERLKEELKQKSG